jgi:hypothetical protein
VISIPKGSVVGCLNTFHPAQEKNPKKTSEIYPVRMI